jgi:hypothetical protein
VSGPTVVREGLIPVVRSNAMKAKKKTAGPVGPTVSPRVRVSLAIKPLFHLLAVNTNSNCAGVADFYGSADITNGIAAAESSLMF